MTVFRIPDSKFRKNVEAGHGLLDTARGSDAANLMCNDEGTYKRGNKYALLEGP